MDETAMHGEPFNGDWMRHGDNCSRVPCTCDHVSDLGRQIMEWGCE